MALDDLGLIGNCQISALVRSDGTIVWCCMPRFDSPPVFGALLDAEQGGNFSIAPAFPRRGVQRYLSNTNVLETRFDDSESSFRILDFAPRFIHYERSFRPTRLIRIVEPLSGTPRIRVSCDPILGWSRERPRREHGSHHIGYAGYGEELRLTTDAPLSYLHGEPFALSSPLRFVLTWGAPVEGPLEPFCDRQLRETVKYWRYWVKHCEIPPIYQEEVIRSALALKLHCFEDTGAIIASHTTSIPEAPASHRTWDYRYCWLRDAYYVLGAFRLLGHFEEREQFMSFLLNVAAGASELNLAPLYRVDGKSDLEEAILLEWPGFEEDGPVRVGNAAATHQQHDVFGEMVLALTPLFLDPRFSEHVSDPVLDLVVRLARKAIAVAGSPDTGIWEYRIEPRPQTFSSLMCWAAADRMRLIAQRHRPALVSEFSKGAERIKEELLSRAVDPVRGCLASDYGGNEVDAALLQAVPLRLLSPDDSRIAATIEAVRRDLGLGNWLRRYRTSDGFAEHDSAFMVCTFWLAEALAGIERSQEARAVLARLKEVRSPLGLLSEDLEPASGAMRGNFPQTYSHVGVIRAAFAASPRLWEYGP